MIRVDEMSNDGIEDLSESQYVISTPKHQVESQALTAWRTTA